MASSVKNGVTTASPWAIVLALPYTAWAALAVTSGIALTIAGPASVDSVGFGLSFAGLVALTAIVLRAAWRAPRLGQAVVTRSGHLVGIAVVVAIPLVVAVLLTAASAPSVTNVGLALPVLGVLAGLSNRARVRTVPAGSIIVSLMLAALATVGAFRAVVGGLESLVSELAIAALAGFVALAIVALVVTLLTVLLRPAGELSD